MKENFNKIFGGACLGIALWCIAASFMACGKATLESSGAYAPATTNAAGQIVLSRAPDLPFYSVDAAFELAYSTTEAAFAFERNNRDMLWRLTPEIKHTLDAIRPQAVDAKLRYALARRAYLANPLPANMTTLERTLAEAKALSAAAAAALPTK